jgi:hypothetical protein
MPADIRVLKTQREFDSGEAIEALRRWLAKAESGEVVQVAIVGVNNDGSVNHEATGGPNLHSLVSGLAILQYRIIAFTEEP